MDITFDTRLRILGQDNIVLADMKVGVPVEAPFVPTGNLLRETHRIIEAWKQLWISYYGETATPADAGAQKWCLEVDSKTEGRDVFQQAHADTVLFGFTDDRVAMFSRLHVMLQAGAAQLTA